jgi:hypothetical protein
MHLRRHFLLLQLQRIYLATHASSTRVIQTLNIVHYVLKLSMDLVSKVIKNKFSKV